MVDEKHSMLKHNLPILTFKTKAINFLTPFFFFTFGLALSIVLWNTSIQNTIKREQMVFLQIANTKVDNIKRVLDYTRNSVSQLQR